MDCRQSLQEGFLCPANLLAGLFTVGVYDNIDHNPSSSTAVGSFHGTGISILQLPTADNHGERRVLSPESADFSSRVRGVPHLPASYANVKAVTLISKKPQVTLGEDSAELYPRGSFNTSWTMDQAWLEHVASAYGRHLGGGLNFSWSVFHAAISRHIITGLNALCPLFYEDSNSVSMVCQGFKVQT